MAPFVLVLHKLDSYVGKNNSLIQYPSNTSIKLLLLLLLLVTATFVNMPSNRNIQTVHTNKKHFMSDKWTEIFDN